MTQITTPGCNQVKIDCGKPGADGLVDVSTLKDYLEGRFKVNGKLNNLGEKVKITTEGSYAVIIQSVDAYSKKYTRYLMKKYLKSADMRDWVRIVSRGKDTYQLVYFNVAE